METDPNFPPTPPTSLPSAPPLQLPGPTPDALLIESNVKLLDQMHQMQATYKQELDAQMQAFREQAFSEFAVICAERDAAQAQVKELKTYIDLNKASTSQNRDSTPQPESNKARRPRPGPTKLTGNAGARTQPPARKRVTLNSNPPPTERRSKNNPRPRVDVTQAPGDGPGSSSQAPKAAVSTSIPSSSTNAAASSTSAATKAPKKKKDRRLREHQIIQSTLDKAAQSLKKGLECHVRFLWGVLSTRAAPVSASAQAVAFFNQRFSGLNVAQLKQQGQMGQLVLGRFGSVQVQGTFPRTLNLNRVRGSGIC
ncbi:hypothetical protein GGX14DRAFT_577390 [Mycena pura]|uniref:Uncharacterized protein n=1 Tax=Mycena pura TaxID=153505 RepID=A0AAD6Y0A3_9AGAR|nr:hypothetical protein GGX14DRAFT_577390 [Mycena pura]